MSADRMRRALVQLMLARPLIDDVDLNSELDSIRSLFGDGDYVDNAIIVQAANERLRKCSLMLRRGVSERDGRQIWALTNIEGEEQNDGANDDILRRMITMLDDKQITVFRGVFQSLVHNDGFVSKIKAETYDDIEEDATMNQDNVVHKMEQKDVIDALKELCKQNWLSKHQLKSTGKDGYVLGDRAYLELQPQLQNFKDEGLILPCNICMGVCLFGITQVNEATGVSSAVHFHCQRRIAGALKSSS